MKALIALALLASTLTGCAVYTPAGSVVIDPAGQHDSGGGGQGRFCPPGQAKKGRIQVRSATKMNPVTGG